MSIDILSGHAFRSLFESSPALQLVLAPNLQIIAVTDAYLKATMTKRDELVGKDMFDAFPDNPDDPNATGVRNLRNSLERVLANRAQDRMPVQKYDIRKPPEQGGGFEVRYWNPLNSPVLNDGGEVAFIIHQVEDVTELVTLQEKGIEQEQIAADLRASNVWFSTTLNSLGDAVIATDAERRVIFMNPMAIHLTGWTEEEAAGKPLSDILPLIDELTGHSIGCPPAQAMREGQTVEVPEHTAIITRDGKQVSIEDSTAPIRSPDGKTIGSVMVFRDITQEKEAAAALSESEEKFRTLADNIPQLAWMADSGGNIFWYNKRWHDYTGTTPQEMMGWGWTAVHDPEVLPSVMTRWKASLDSGEPFSMVFPLKGSDGHFRPFLTRVMPVRDDSDTIVRWFGTNTDITESMEEARRKDEFLAMLAHELRNPLSSISNAVNLLQMPNVPAEHAEWSREIIAKQVKHLARLIDDLLDVSRITRGKIELRKERMEVSAVINSAVDTVRTLVEEKKQELAVSFTPGTLWCEVDPTRLEQVLINLLTNATRYTPAGGHIWLSARHQGDQITFKVKDTGIGIPSDQLDAMFELFAQGDRSAARSEGGLGIGLTIVKRLAELHGGTASARSEGSGKGSEFAVTLPAIPRPRDMTRKQAIAGQAGPMRCSRILIVDDNVDTAKGLARLLRLLGHEIHIVHEGKLAITEALTFRPEIVLLDIGLPGMDGYQVARALRSEPELQQAVLIALTGYGQEEDRRRSSEAGFNHHLVKPVDYDSLVSLIAQPV